MKEEYRLIVQLYANVLAMNTWTKCIESFSTYPRRCRHYLVEVADALQGDAMADVYLKEDVQYVN